MKLTEQVQYWTGVGLLVAVAGLYLLTLDNGLRPDELTGGDLITHQYAQVEARLSNAPGYPLYTMGGWLWFHFGRILLGWAFNPIQILSLYSTLWGLAALLMLYLILLQVSGRQWWLAPLLTAFYATTFFFWYYSVTTEQYSSAVLQTLLLIWLAFKWHDRPRDSTLLWMACLCGTMLANMVTTLFILPPLLWFIFFHRTTQNLTLFDYLKRPGFALKAVSLALLPLSSYIYVYIRGAQHPEWRGAGEWISTREWFIQFLTIQQGRDELGPGLSSQNIFTDEFPILMIQELTWLVFFGGLLGLIWLGKRRAIFLYSALLIYFLFSWGYRFGNWFQVIIPAYPIFVIGLTAGMRRIVEVVEQRANWKIGRLEGWKIGHLSLNIRVIFAILLISLLAYRLTSNLPRANQRDLATDTGLDPGWAILADEPKSPAIIAGDFEERGALQYLRTMWSVASRITPVDFASSEFLPVEQDNLSFYISRRAAAANVEVLEQENIHFQAAGEQLIALWPSPRLELPIRGVIPLDLAFSDKLKLLGWEQLESSYPLPYTVPAKRNIRANWQIALYWQAAEKLSEDYTVSVRPLVEGQLLNVAGETIIQDHQPVWGLYPTSRWRSGEIIRDVYALNLPEGMMPDAAQIVVYRVTDTGFENLAEQVIGLGSTNSK